VANYGCHYFYVSSFGRRQDKRYEWVHILGRWLPENINWA
jgi:hypothetical protein